MMLKAMAAQKRVSILLADASQMRLNKHILIRERIIGQQCHAMEQWTVCRESNWPFPVRVPVIPSHSYSLVNFLLSSMVEVSKDFFVKQWMPKHLACRMPCLERVGGWVLCAFDTNHYLFWRAVLERTNRSLNAVSPAVAAKPQKQHLLQKGQQSATSHHWPPNPLILYLSDLVESQSLKKSINKMWHAESLKHQSQHLKALP